MTIRKLISSVALAIVLSTGISADALAATSTVNITSTAYASVAGPGAVAATVTATKNIQYIFSATQPTLGSIGHELPAGQSIPLSTMGSGIYMWVISDTGSGVVVVTSGTDAIINNGASASGSGGVAQASTTSGQTGTLVQGAVTTSAPSYTTGKTNPISLDTSGNVRINCVTGCGGGSGGTAQTDTAAFTAGTTSFTPIGGVFSNGLSAVTTGQNSTARITSDRAILVSQIPPTAASGVVTNVDSTAYEASHVISNAPATLLGCFGYNSKTSAQFMQIFNSTTVPADTTAPTVAPINVAASSSWSIDFGAYGRPFSTGIAISNSSTGATKTIGSADSWFSCRIK